MHKFSPFRITNVNTKIKIFLTLRKRKSECYHCNKDEKTCTQKWPDTARCKATLCVCITNKKRHLLSRKRTKRRISSVVFVFVDLSASVLWCCRVAFLFTYPPPPSAPSCNWILKLSVTPPLALGRYVFLRQTSHYKGTHFIGWGEIF